ncbi:hypothetical protein GCM10009760_21210 [Kitasatospora kazusensis]|uniref:TauD/TfdA-like domain-containing protein n=1 Tax=Kitasatospora kazusensis TaxID=407974 RepID=A0ABN2ZAI8_9ACTN
MPAYHLSEPARAALSSRPLPADLAPDDWPDQAPDDAARDLAPARAEALRLLDGEPGWLVVHTGLAALDDHRLMTAAWNLFTALCEPVPQYRTGELVFPVEVTDAPTEASSHYSRSNATGGFHTDGTLLDLTPQVAALIGLSSADSGGETVLVDGFGLADHLAAEAPDHLALLEQAHPFHSGDQGEDPVMEHRIVDLTGERLRLHYLRRYIDRGYEHTGRTRPDGLSAALDAWDALVADPARQNGILLERGDILLWNNARFIHGRTPFEERTRRRRLRRAYGVHRPSGPSLPSGADRQGGR